MTSFPSNLYVCTPDMNARENTIWLLTLFATILPTIFNLVAIFTTCYIIYMVISLKKLAEATTITSHLFLKTAVKSGVGSTFKEKLNDYASSKDDMKNLIQPVSRC